MIHYIIDGNNFIGKAANLLKKHKWTKENSRLRAASLIDNYFMKKNLKGTLHFDGFETDSLKLIKLKIIYSGKKEADDMIRSEIENQKNRHSLVIISSDGRVAGFAKVCSCKVFSSEEFVRMILNSDIEDEEEKKINEINNDEFKRLFGE